MKTFFSLSIAVLLAGPSAWASEVYETTIASVEAAGNAAESTLVYLEQDGRVLRLDRSQAETIEALRAAAQSGDYVELDVSDLGEFDHAKIISVSRDFGSVLEGAGPRLSFIDIPDVMAGYAPSDLGTPENVAAVFATQTKRLAGDSQCYQRAMVWAYDMYTKQNINSMKVFLFFTSKYIRAYSYKWWFHVAPFVTAAGTEYVMDRTFAKSPKLMKEWTDMFMKGKWACPVVERYSDYRDHQSSQYCYLAKVPMYYYQPKDVKALEEKDKTWTDFDPWSIRHARSIRY